MQKTQLFKDKIYVNSSLRKRKSWKNTAYLKGEYSTRECEKKKAVEDKNKPILQLHFLQLTKRDKGTHTQFLLKLNWIIPVFCQKWLYCFLI